MDIDDIKSILVLIAIAVVGGSVAYIVTALLG
jgi:hypothetical protein